MADEIFLASGMDGVEAAMAYLASDGVPWHGLGNALQPGAGLETWTKQAGFNYTIEKSPIEYEFTVQDADLGEIKQVLPFPGRVALHRSDTGHPFSIVSNRYKEVQPAEIMDFFAKWCEAGDMQMRTAGVLGQGQVYWALASIGESFDINGLPDGTADHVDTFVLLTTSCDKSMATTCKICFIRVVCRNTLNAALRSKNGERMIKVPHSTKFDPDLVKREMGLVHETVQNHVGQMRKLHTVSLDDGQAVRFFLELVKSPEEKATGKVDITKHGRYLNRFWDSYKTAPGAEDTLWGAVNGVTHAVDFNQSTRSADTRLRSAWFGAGDKIKSLAYATATNDPLIEQVFNMQLDEEANLALESPEEKPYLQPSELMGSLLNRPARTGSNG